MDDNEVLDAVGPRLRAVRQKRSATLAQLSSATGISVSTLSRLEAGGRRATLELLLPLARAHQVPLDELIGAPATTDPRVHPEPVRRHGRTLFPLTRHPGGMQAYKVVGPPEEPERELQSHEGYEWMYVLTGRLRLRLGELDLVLKPGEVAEFDAHTPHWFGSAGPRPVELLVLFGPQGERLHVCARPERVVEDGILGPDRSVAAVPMNDPAADTRSTAGRDLDAEHACPGHSPTPRPVKTPAGFPLSERSVT